MQGPPASELAKPGGPLAAPAGQLAAARTTISSLLESTITWWAQHGPDLEQGGFFTTLDQFGGPVLTGVAADKFLVPCARQVYAWSTLVQQRSGDGRARELAARAYQFLTNSALMDGEEGFFRWQVSRDGKVPVHSEEVLYGQAFAILALSRYGRVLGDPSAVAAALLLFERVDAERHDDEHGGYLETSEQGYPPGVGTGEGRGVDKSFNTHLHLVEALTELSSALAGPQQAPAKAAVEARLAELLRLVPSKVWVADGGGTTSGIASATSGTAGGTAGGHLSTNFKADWTPLNPSDQDYGHEIEALYVMLAAARQLRWQGAELAALRSFAARVGQAAQRGYDAAGGGGFWRFGGPEGPVLRGSCSGGVWFKEWWPQFEGLSGLFWHWRLTGEVLSWEHMLGTICHLAGDLADPEGGEFFGYWAPAKGAPVCGGAAKADKWKANYHVLRALLYMDEWLAAVAGAREPEPKI